MNMHTLSTIAFAALPLVFTAPPSGAQDAEATRVEITDPYQAERERMVREDIANSGFFGREGVSDPAVLNAMRAVPRHLFVPEHLANQAYADRPLPIGEGQTISQPYIVAFMTEALHVDADDVVLEVGTGSGYQAAVLAQIVAEVYTIEIIEPLAEQAKKRFEDQGYGNIFSRAGDGYLGWPEKAPFDAIIVTAAPDIVPPALLDQLKPGGRIVVPVGPEQEVQNLMLIEKREDGKTIQRNLMPVRFVPMTRPRAEERK